MIMPKVMIFVNHDVVIYNFRLELVERLLKEKYQVIISAPNGEKIEKLKQLGCTHVVTDIRRHGTNLFRELKLLVHYYRILRKNQPDVVLTYTVKPNLYVGLVCRLLKIPYIANITGLGTAFAKPGMLSKCLLIFYRFALKKAWKVFFQNSDNQHVMQVHKVVHGNDALLPGSGVNLEKNAYESYPEESQGITFITIGRIMKDKGTDELIAAATAVKKEFPETRFVMLGFFDGVYEQKIQEAQENGIIEYDGFQEDVHDFIKKSHALIHPSYHEGMANVILEAAATGRPILASDIPGCREAIDDHATGLLFAPRDVQSLEKTIREFVCFSHDEKAEMGRLGRIKMQEHFDRSIVVDAYMREIKSILN